MRVALLTDGIYPFEIGGMQRHAHHLAREFLINGIDLTIYHCVVDKEIPNDVHYQLEKSFGFSSSIEFQSHCFRFPRLKVPIIGHYIFESYLYSKLVFEHLSKESSFQYIYSKGFSAWYLLRRKRYFPLIGVQFHGLEMFQPSSSLKSYLEKFVLRPVVRYCLIRADDVFSYGGDIKRMLLKLGVDSDKIQIQYGGVDSRLLIQPEEIVTIDRPIKFLFVGRNERRKGYKELKRVVEQLLTTHDFEVSFVGTIPCREKIEDQKVTYFGEVSSLNQYLSIIDAHDVLVVPSKSEGLPTVILEAMCRGKTILSTNVGAISEIVNEQNGLLITSNEFNSLKAGLIQFLNMDAKEIKSKQENSLKVVSKNFDWKILGNKVVRHIKYRIDGCG